MVLVELLGKAVEVLLVVKLGQLIALGGLDDVAVLRELDRALQARFDDADGGIGLRNEVDSPELEALDLGFFLGRRDDDGNTGERFVLFDRFQHVQTGHHRHQDVEQNQREGGCVLP